MGLAKKLVEISERAKEKINISIVGDVVAEVGHAAMGRTEQDPDGIDTE